MTIKEAWEKYKNRYIELLNIDVKIDNMCEESGKLFRKAGEIYKVDYKNYADTDILFNQAYIYESEIRILLEQHVIEYRKNRMEFVQFIKKSFNNIEIKWNFSNKNKVSCIINKIKYD